MLSLSGALLCGGFPQVLQKRAFGFNGFPHTDRIAEPGVFLAAGSKEFRIFTKPGAGLSRVAAFAQIIPEAGLFGLDV